MARPLAYNRTEVLRKAMLCFWQNGFDGTSIQHLVEATGVNRGSLYAEFKGKKELYKYSFLYYLEMEFSPSIARLNESEHFQKDLLSFLTQESVSAQFLPPGCFLAHCLADFGGKDAEVNQMLQSAVEKFISSLTEILSNHLGPDPQRRLQSESLLQLLLGQRLLRKVLKTAPESENSLAHFIKHL